MILGYTFNGHSSNNVSFFDGNEPKGVLCACCGTCLDDTYSPEILDINQSRKYDISYTDDLRNLYSERFYLFCKDVLKADVKFKQIKTRNMVLYYMIPPKKILEFDIVRRETKFEKKCKMCGGYESVAGAFPPFLKINKPLGHGFFRTDVIFGSGREKGPLFIIGNEWKKLLAAQKFRGIDFEEIVA